MKIEMYGEKKDVAFALEFYRHGEYYRAILNIGYESYGEFWPMCFVEYQSHVVRDDDPIAEMQPAEGIWASWYGENLNFLITGVTNQIEWVKRFGVIWNKILATIKSRNLYEHQDRLQQVYLALVVLAHEYKRYNGEYVPAK